jgi:hypothetical protein
MVNLSLYFLQGRPPWWRNTMAPSGWIGDPPAARAKG